MKTGKLKWVVYVLSHKGTFEHAMGFKWLGYDTPESAAEAITNYLNLNTCRESELSLVIVGRVSTKTIKET